MVYNPQLKAIGKGLAGLAKHMKGIGTVLAGLAKHIATIAQAVMAIADTVKSLKRIAENTERIAAALEARQDA